MKSLVISKAIGTTQGLGKPTGWAHLSRCEASTMPRQQMGSSGMSRKANDIPTRSHSPESCALGLSLLTYSKTPACRMPMKHRLVPRH